MNILSLFDGMSCGQLALQKLGVKVDNYFASEIDKYAMEIAKKNFPNTIHIGDVTQIKYWNGNLKGEFLDYDAETIDLLIGGSPCQGFSFAGKQLNFQDERSKLFFEYVRILNEVKPKWFMLENVKMKKEYQDIISDNLFGIQPVEINSALLSAQSRKRLYWVGELQPNGSYKQVKIDQPQDRGILLKDILEDEVDEKYNISNKHTDAMIRARNSGKLNIPEIEGKCGTLIASYYKIPQDGPYIKQLNNPSHPNNRIYGTDGKSTTLNTTQGGHRQPKILLEDELKIRKLTPTECERLQTVPDGYTEGVSNSQRYKMLGNGWTVDVIAHIFNNIFKKNEM